MVKGRSVKGHGSKVKLKVGQVEHPGVIKGHAGAKGHQAKGHGITGQNLEIKSQEVKG